MDRIKPRNTVTQTHFSYHGSLVLACSLCQYAATGAFKALELEDPGVVDWQVLHGVPGGGAETLQTPVALEPGKEYRSFKVVPWS